MKGRELVLHLTRKLLPGSSWQSIENLDVIVRRKFVARERFIRTWDDPSQ